MSISKEPAIFELAQLKERVRSYQPAADLELLERAYLYSEKAHTGQTRKSGDPYFSHPASVAGIITELRLDLASVCAGLLHDVVEDTLATVTDIERSSARRSRSSSTASPSCRRSTSPRRKTARRRTSARWWSPWRATSACCW
jgi:hypothetical protein